MNMLTYFAGWSCSPEDEARKNVTFVIAAGAALLFLRFALKRFNKRTEEMAEMNSLLGVIGMLVYLAGSFFIAAVIFLAIAFLLGPLCS